MKYSMQCEDEEWVQTLCSLFTKSWTNRVLVVKLQPPPLPHAPRSCAASVAAWLLAELGRSLEISKELDQQNKMLENVNTDFEEAIGGLDAVTKKTQELIKKSGELSESSCGNR